MKGKLIKLVSSHENLRTPIVFGDFERPPSIGERFEMTSDPLDPAAAMRWIQTSPVEYFWCAEIQKSKVVCFKTENSVYALVLGES